MRDDPNHRQNPICLEFRVVVSHFASRALCSTVQRNSLGLFKGRRHLWSLGEEAERLELQSKLTCPLPHARARPTVFQIEKRRISPLFAKNRLRMPYKNDEIQHPSRNDGLLA
jgi:hypothetical protein